MGFLDHEYIAELLKNKNSDFSLSQLKDNRGREFPNSDARNDFVVNHFKNLFSESFEPAFSLNDFFGDNDLNNPLLEQHKLSEEEKNDLEGEFTMEELKESLKQSNLDSSPGLDGISMKLYKRFWDLI